MLDRKLLSKYSLVLENNRNINADITDKLIKLDSIIRNVMDKDNHGGDLFTSYNDFLISLLDSSDTNIVNAATSAMNNKPEPKKEEPPMPPKEEPAPAPVQAQPKVKKEEDEAMGNANDNKNGVTGTGF